jgi:GNAT superfamily N-acetyltransferase
MTGLPHSARLFVCAPSEGGTPAVNRACAGPQGECCGIFAGWGHRGHCFLAADNSGCAQLAIFIRQDSRRKGVGTAVAKPRLEWERATGLRRVWSITSSDNTAALRRLQMNCGLHLTRSISYEAELEIDLPVP